MWGSKRIRYPRSPHPKLCQLEIGELLILHQNLSRYDKFLDSGGSMVARAKLKGIDGTAPPGVERAA